MFFYFPLDEIIGYIKRRGIYHLWTTKKAGQWKLNRSRSMDNRYMPKKIIVLFNLRITF